MGRTWKPLLVLAVFSLTLALGSILSPALAGEGGQEKIESLKAKKHKLQEKALAARRAGKLDEYRKLRGKIHEIDRKIGELSRQGREGNDREALLKKLKMLHAMQAHARRQGNHEAVERLGKEIERLRGQIHGKGSRPSSEHQVELKRKLDALHKKIKALKKERDKSLEEFDLDRVDALSREIAELEEAGARIREALEKSGKERPRPSPRDTAAERTRLFKELREAQERGDEKAANALRAKIARLGRGERPGRSFAPKAVEGLERMVHKLEAWARGAKEKGSHDKAKALVQVAQGFRDIARKTQMCRNPEEALGIARYLEEILERAHRDLRQADEDGDDERVELLKWASGQLKGVLGHLQERIRAPRGRGGEEKRRKIDWLMKQAEELQRQGRHEEAEKHRKMAEELERQLHKERAGSDGPERRFREMEERIEDLMRESNQARREGDAERAADLQRKAMELRRELAQARRDQEGNRRRGGAGRGRGGREREMDRDRHLARLLRELDRAERDGNEDRMKELRREIERHKEEMERRGRPDRDREDRGAREDERRSREARELKKEIDRLRRELQELKKLLMQLLKEKGKD